LISIGQKLSSKTLSKAEILNNLRAVQLENLFITESEQIVYDEMIKKNKPNFMLKKLDVLVQKYNNLLKKDTKKFK
jgi:hypothetical protein